MLDKHTGMDATVRRIRRTRGLSTQIARRIGVARTAVYQWKKVPPHWVMIVADITGLTPEKIRPDIFKALTERADTERSRPLAKARSGPVKPNRKR